MNIICYIEQEREWKTRAFMSAFADGARAQHNTATLVKGIEVKQNTDLHVLWGHRWFSQKAVPQIEAAQGNYIVIDNGWFDAANGRQSGYFRVMINGPENRLIPGMPADRIERLNAQLLPWQTKRGDKVLICMPGPHFGLPWGINTQEWERDIIDDVRKYTDRDIIVRRKGSTTPLVADLLEAHAMVTHSSAVAVTAVTVGIPVFCEATCAAHPVRAGGLQNIETPAFPDRDEWLRSLTYQQWDLQEFRSGKAWAQIKEQLK